MSSKKKALSLFSGGLDSILAVLLLRDQGIQVEGITFESPFFSADLTKKTATQLNMPLKVVDFTEDILGVIESPRHGFGQCLNPCVDCHALMFKRAGEAMRDLGCSYIFTGEVLNERPMSQNKKSLKIVAVESGFDGLILRPLSALLLDITIPEEKGWVNRKMLLDIEGRSRKRQFALAKEYGIKNYPTPSGGCKLTEPHFTKRLKDLKNHEGLKDVRLINSLKYGRHFRLPCGSKLIMGRNAEDNRIIESASLSKDIILKPKGVPGPTGFLPSTNGTDCVQFAAEICASYCDAPAGTSVTFLVKTLGGIRGITAIAAERNLVESLRL